MSQTNRRVAKNMFMPLEGRKECVLNWTFLVGTRVLEERHFHFLFEILIKIGVFLYFGDSLSDTVVAHLNLCTE